MNAPVRSVLKVQRHHAAPIPAVSSGICAGSNPGDLVGLLSGRKSDPRAFRRLYPTRWPEFLRRHFHSKTHVQVFFDVDERCARNWWEGTTGPQGWAVEYALREVPGARAWLEAA